MKGPADPTVRQIEDNVPRRALYQYTPVSEETGEIITTLDATIGKFHIVCKRLLKELRPRAGV